MSSLCSRRRFFLSSAFYCSFCSWSLLYYYFFLRSSISDFNLLSYFLYSSTGRLALVVPSARGGSYPKNFFFSGFSSTLWTSFSNSSWLNLIAYSNSFYSCVCAFSSRAKDIAIAFSSSNLSSSSASISICLSWEDCSKSMKFYVLWVHAFGCFWVPKHQVLYFLWS